MYIQSVGRAARYYPSRTALVSGRRRTTFAELHEKVSRIAAALTAHGFATGDRLAILLPNEPEYLELVYACSWLGVTAVPLNTRLSRAELDQILRDASPHGLVRHSSLPLPSTQVPWQLVLDESPLNVGQGSPKEAIYDPQSVLAIVYTSGTTGTPKGVVLTHANVLANVHFLNYWMPYQEGGVYLHAAPMFHVMDFPLMFAAPAFGTCQATIPKFSPEAFCEEVERERVSRSMLVPTMIKLLTEFPDLGKYNLTSLEQLGYGASPIAPDLIRRTRELFPHLKLVQGYGSSETGFLTGLMDQEHTENRLLSCGRPCPGIDLRIVDESGNAVEPGKHGELVARGANVMSGYFNDPDATRLAFRDGLFRTGDVGYQDAEGYFFISDRLKDMIDTGGEKVYCGEIEAVISTHPAVREVAVFGVPDPDWGEIVMACVVLKPGSMLPAEDLIAYCRQLLSHYKVPRRVEFLQEGLPRNASGKILKRSLRERYWTGRQRAVG